MRCIICDKNEWENIDHVRIKPQGLSICKHCGFVSYPSKWKSEEDIKAHYRTEYRKPPGAMNIFTGERKNHFHAKFLSDYFDKWKTENKKLVVGEIGAAFGLTLHWVKRIFPDADVSGTELTTSFQRVAHHEYGIKLTDDFDESKKYDLIMSYKVAEHQLDIDKMLLKYKEALKPDGYIYISVPTWFDSMVNFGLGGFDLEYYYDPNHVNVWTKKLFKTLLKKVGLETVKEDHAIYGSTFLCKRNDSLMGQSPQFENLQDIKDRAERIKKAFILMNESKLAEAIAIYPNYPTAWINHIELKRKELAEIGWQKFKEKYIEQALKVCPDQVDLLVMATDYAMRAKEWKEAITFCEEAMHMKPENPVALSQLANIMREMAINAKGQEKLHYFKQARDVARHLRAVSAQHFNEATDLIFAYTAEIPFNGEAVGSFKPVLKGVPDGSAEASL